MRSNGNGGAIGSAFEFVPSAVVERASVHDMVYAACPRCFASLQARMQSRASALPAEDTIECASCGSLTKAAAVQYKYRLKIQVAYGVRVVDAMLFDEVAQGLIGVSASRLRKLQRQYPSLPWLLEELLVGLHVSLRYQRPEYRSARTTAGAEHKPKFTKDLKVVSIAPLASVLLPKPVASLAMEALALDHRHSCSSGDDDTDE